MWYTTAELEEERGENGHAFLDSKKCPQVKLQVFSKNMGADTKKERAPKLFPSFPRSSNTQLTVMVRI